jgi:hypothetical protein
MAIRKPLYYDTVSNNLVELNETEISQIVEDSAYLWGLNPTIQLNVTANNASNLSPAFIDTRWTAGTVSNSNRAFPAETTTQEPQLVTVSYQRIQQTVTSVSLPTSTLNEWPVYYTTGGNIQAMTLEDMKDTFFHPAIDLLTSSTTLAGIYTVSTATSLANHTIVSSTPIFSDTRANLALYTAAGIPEAVDQPTTINNYYLYKRNIGVRPSYSRTPMFTNSNGDLGVYNETVSQLSNKISAWMRYLTVNSTEGYKIRYSINGTGTVKGTSIINTIVGLTNTGNYQTLQVGDDYRAQEFPANVNVAAANIYNLTINKD